MRKISIILIAILITMLVIISCNKTSSENSEAMTKVVYTEIQSGTDDGVYTGSSMDKVGNISLVYMTVENEKIKSIKIDEIGHGHGGIIAGQNKRGNKEYQGYMMREANISWDNIINNVEKVIVEKQTANIEDIDALSGATVGFTSDNLALAALVNAITVAKESSDFFRLEQ